MSSAYAWRQVCDGFAANCAHRYPIELYRRKSDTLPPCPQAERPTEPAAAEADDQPNQVTLFEERNEQ